MAIKKIRMRPEGANDYGDILHPETTADQVKFNDGSTVESHKADYAYQVASGTATVITLTINNLKDGYPITFIASANNNGNATTINGKQLYKPNTTETPNLVLGKAYTIWYNQTGNCFFIKASAEGNASVEHVLAGKTFSNDDDTGLVGTMPNRSGNNNALDTSMSGQTLRLKAPQGYYDGVGDTVQNSSPDWIASNILKGKNIFGLLGSLELGVKFAQGSTQVAPDGKIGFTTFEGVVYDFYKISVSGLTFKPKLVLLRKDGDNAFTVYMSYTATNRRIIADWGQRSGNAVNSVSVQEVHPVNISTSGFTLPVLTPAGTWYWYAFG